MRGLTPLVKGACVDHFQIPNSSTTKRRALHPLALNPLYWGNRPNTSTLLTPSAYGTPTLGLAGVRPPLFPSPPFRSPSAKPFPSPRFSPLRRSLPFAKSAPCGLHLAPRGHLPLLCRLSPVKLVQLVAGAGGGARARGGRGRARLAGSLVPAHALLIILLEIELGWLSGCRVVVRLDGGLRHGRLARSCRVLGDLLQWAPRLRRPTYRYSQGELWALHPFLEVAHDLQPRGWAAQQKADEAANGNHVLVGAVRPLQVHTDAIGMQWFLSMHVGGLK